MAYENANDKLFQLPALEAPIQIFDVDHTITSRSTGVRMGQVGLKEKYITRFTLMQFPLHYMRYRAGNYTFDNIPKKLKQFEGISQAKIDAWGDRTFKEFILEDIYPPMLKLIRHLKAAGKKVILCTSSTYFIVKPLAEFLEADALISTQLRFESGFCTGEIVDGPAFGEGKVYKMQEYLEEHKVQMSDTAFYSDSINDLPLLLKTAYPVPTNPDRLLRKVCKARGWEFLEYRRRKTKTSGGPA